MALFATHKSKNFSAPFLEWRTLNPPCSSLSLLSLLRNYHQCFSTWCHCRFPVCTKITLWVNIRRRVFIQSDLPCFCHFHIPDQDKQSAIQHSPWSNTSARLMGDDGPTSWSHKRTRKLLNISTRNQQKPGLYLTLGYNLVSKTIDL